MDYANLLEQVLDLLAQYQIRYCIIGGQGVNAYVDPVVSLDLDMVVAVEQAALVEQLFATHFQLRRFPYSLNISLPNSDLRVQIQTDNRYSDFVERAVTQEVLGVAMPVARVEDVLQGKVWAAQDAERRPSKRQKDLADIARLLESYPHLRNQVPTELLAKLL